MALFLLVAVVEVSDRVVEGARSKLLVREHGEAVAVGIGLLPPAHVALCACLLRTHIGVELLVGCLLIDADVL